jgi:hypothetical protein
MIRLSSQEISEGTQNTAELMDALIKRVRRPDIEISAFKMVPIGLHLLHSAAAGILRHCTILAQEASFSFGLFLLSAWNSVAVLIFWRSRQS